MSSVFIKPKKGKQIPDPVRGGFLPETGANVDENDIYWHRRLSDGDVEIAKPEKTKA
jgi:hypothetical protein